MPRSTTRGAGATLPPWRSVLAVVAHPDDESFGLGAVIDSFVGSGAKVSVLCLTHGEASTLHGVTGDLGVIRAAELQAAADALRVAGVRLESFPDGALDRMPRVELAALVARFAATVAAEGLLAFDRSGVTGHPDHIAATEAAVLAGERERLGVLAWALPLDVSTTLTTEFGVPFVGYAPDTIDLVIPVDRRRQLEAVGCHPSQVSPNSVLWRRLELLGDAERLRWLHVV